MYPAFYVSTSSRSQNRNPRLPKSGYVKCFLLYYASVCELIGAKPMVAYKIGDRPLFFLTALLPQLCLRTRIRPRYWSERQGAWSWVRGKNRVFSLSLS